MNQSLTEQIATLLQQAGAAHYTYEQDELKGVYDTDWPRWYAAWAIENGLCDLMKIELSVGDLASLLVQINETHQQSESDENWAHFTAARLVEKYQR